MRRRAIKDPGLPGLSGPRKAAVIAGLIAFILVDVALVSLALSRVSGDADDSAPNLGSQATVTGQESGETRDSPTSDAARSVPRLLSVVSETVAWRSEGGACDERGSLELTVDGGETWIDAYPSNDQLGRALWISGADESSVQAVIASGADCELEGMRTYDAGESWSEEAQVVSNSVLVKPGDPAFVTWGGEDLAGPCAEMSTVAVTQEIATALCSDGTVWSLPSGAAEWTAFELEPAVTLSAAGGRSMALSETAECDGLGLVEFADDAEEALACTPVQTDDAAVLDMSEDNVWIWADDRVLVSADSGRSFAP